MKHKFYILQPEAAKSHVSWLQPYVDAKMLNKERQAWRTQPTTRIRWRLLIKKEYLDDLSTVLTVAQMGKKITYRQASLQLIHDLINGFVALCSQIKENKNGVS